ncbi:hypothetical protein D3C80_2176220 [compost metagenome]
MTNLNNAKMLEYILAKAEQTSKAEAGIFVISKPAVHALNDKNYRNRVFTYRWQSYSINHINDNDSHIHVKHEYRG